MKVKRHDPPELLRYWVQSESNPTHWYLVDLLDFECDCMDFQCRKKPDPDRVPCKHIHAALEEFALDVLGKIRRLTETRDGP